LILYPGANDGYTKAPMPSPVERECDTHKTHDRTPFLKLLTSAALASLIGALIGILSLIPRAMQRWEISAGSLPPIGGILISALPMPWLAIVVTPIIFWTLFKLETRFRWEVHLLVASCSLIFLVGALVVWTMLRQETEMLAPGPEYSAITWTCNFVYVALFATCLSVSRLHSVLPHKNPVECGITTGNPLQSK
jgi:hypothetical protein